MRQVKGCEVFMRQVKWVQGRYEAVTSGVALV